MAGGLGMDVLDCRFLLAVYKYSPVGLVILNSKTELVDVNDYMLGSFKIGEHKYKGKQFGNFFGCASVAQSGVICGEAPECFSCGIRGGLRIVLNNDEKVRNTTISHTFVQDGVKSLKWFNLSASAVNAEDGRYAIVSFADITREKQYEQLLQHELTIDLATGTVNKSSLIDILVGLSRYAGQGNVVSVGIIDFDDFKNINDTYGHLKGDEVLQKFSEISRENIRRQDILGRYGGEEFMFVIPGADIALAAKIIKRIYDAVTLYFNKQGVAGVSFSAGFMELKSDEIGNTTKEQIIEAVDGCLYQAKRSGKKKLVSNNLTIEF
jgi:diguanylate cyclase (GGDEF)-like protein